MVGVVGVVVAVVVVVVVVVVAAAAAAAAVVEHEWFSSLKRFEKHTLISTGSSFCCNEP